MTFEEAKKAKAAREAAMNYASARLSTFPQLANGLTPDDVKATTEWQSAKAASDKAFAELRAFNAFYVKKFAKELRAERRQRLART